MAQEFYMDSQFDIPYWIDVDNGIVKNISCGDKKVAAKMNEVYVGKTITFLKEDFETRMKPSYYCVKSGEIHSALATYETMIQRLRNYNRYVRNFHPQLMESQYPKEQLVVINRKREKYQNQINEAKSDLYRVCKEVETKHGFNLYKLPDNL